MWTYSVVLTPDDNDTVMASVPDVPGVHTFGDDEADALARAEDALVTMLMAHIQAREPITAPRRARAGSTTVTLPPLVGLKLALYEAMRTAGVGKAELARRLHVHLPQVDRLLDLEHASKLDAVVEALRVMGRDVEVTVRPSKTRSAA
jgi:antitoxin HicB